MIVRQARQIDPVYSLKRLGDNLPEQQTRSHTPSHNKYILKQILLVLSVHMILQHCYSCSEIACLKQTIWMSLRCNQSRLVARAGRARCPGMLRCARGACTMKARPYVCEERRATRRMRTASSWLRAASFYSAFAIAHVLANMWNDASTSARCAMFL
jgi:hypothetical protein